jgi:WD40 repeat protein
VVAGPFEGHEKSVRSVAFSSDGKRVVSGSLDKTICIWDAETWHVVADPFEGHKHRVSSVAFSTDGKRVVSSSGNNMTHIWEPPDLKGFAIHEEQASAIFKSFSADGKRV